MPSNNRSDNSINHLLDMEVSKPGGSCKVAASSRLCCNNNNKLQLQTTHAWLLLLLLVPLGSSTCLALPLEATTIAPDLDEVTTTISPQLLASAATTPITVIANETAIKSSENEPTATGSEVAESLAADDFTDNSFVPLGVNLEEGIRNAVRSEVESDIEAASAALVETLQDYPKKKVVAVESVENQDTSFIATEEPINIINVPNVRESKTLKTDEDEEKPVEAEPAVVGDDIAPKASTTEPEQEQPIPATTERQVERETTPLPKASDVISIIFDENRAITEQPIAKTNLLGLEQELEILKSKDTTPAPIFEITKHQVTKKQGVEDLLTIDMSEIPAAAVVEPELAELEITEAVTELVGSHEKQETNNQELDLEDAEVSVHLNEVDGDENVAEKGEEEPEAEVEHKVLKEAEPEPEPTIKPLASEKESIEAVHNKSEEEKIVEEEKKEKKEVVEIEQLESSTPQAEPESAEETLKHDEKSGVEISQQHNEQDDVDAKEEDEQNVTNKPEDVKDSQANENEDEDSKNDDTAQTNDEQTEVTAVDPVLDDDSSKEHDQPSADEPKPRADDSTATPLVSYPPHNAGQTFNDNLADERTAHLSLASSSRSALIIALCSGTAVLFIVISLIIFVVSFQRQHGTLDIEMQEQRLGKDTLDEEDAQMKLLDVELSTRVTNATTGNEETDECL